VLWGDSATTLCDVANTQPCELMVMCTHGRTGLAHVFMGSVAERVVCSAPCNVRIMRAFPQPQPSTVRQQRPTTLAPALRAGRARPARINGGHGQDTAHSCSVLHPLRGQRSRAQATQ
jgi:hypothetical protein